MDEVFSAVFQPAVVATAESNLPPARFLSRISVRGMSTDALKTMNN